MHTRGSFYLRMIHDSWCSHLSLMHAAVVKNNATLRKVLYPNNSRYEGRHFFLGGGRQWHEGCHVLQLRVCCLKSGGFQIHVWPIISQWFVGGIALCDLKQARNTYVHHQKPMKSVLSRREKVPIFQTNPQTPLKHWDAVEDFSGRFELFLVVQVTIQSWMCFRIVGL